MNTYALVAVAVLVALSISGGWANEKFSSLIIFGIDIAAAGLGLVVTVSHRSVWPFVIGTIPLIVYLVSAYARRLSIPVHQE
jgi:hypothetical protein